MPRYRVCWEIDIEAGDTVRAAQMALRIQRDPESTATAFRVGEFREGAVCTLMETVDLIDTMNEKEGEYR